MLIGMLNLVKISSCTRRPATARNVSGATSLGVTGFGGGGLVVVRRVVVLDRQRELADLLASDLEVVRCR